MFNRKLQIKYFSLLISSNTFAKMIYRVLISLLFVGVLCGRNSAFSCTDRLEEAIDITDGVNENGAITFGDITYTPQNYFRHNNQTYGCICKVKICLNKCCTRGKMFVNNTCEQYETELDIDVYRGIEKSNLTMDDFYLLRMHKMCSGKKYMLTENHQYYIQENGHVYMPWGNLTNTTEYCYEGTTNSKIQILVCAKEEDRASTTTTSIGMIISMPFLLATFLVYAFLPDRNLPAKALMCYVLSLLFAYIILVTIQLNSAHQNKTCITLAFFCYFFFMASFFWMNASCLDIFFTFSGIRGLLGDRKKENRRFLYYSAYAWGVPVLMVGFAAIFTFGDIDNNDHFYTGLGNGQCWFKNGWATGIYFYFPIALLLIVNIVLFGITTYKIKRVQRDTKMLKNVDSRKHKFDNNDKQRFNLYVKLLFAMGINWSMEVISWAIMWKWTAVPDYVWVLTDFCNAVYGVFIFFIFVFKRNIWILLKKRYLQLTGKPQQAHTLTSTHRTTITSSLQSLSKSLERKITPSCMHFDQNEKN